VTLIGDHTDYNEGLSLPIAVDLFTEATFSEQADSFFFGLSSDQFDEPWEIPLPNDPHESVSRTHINPPEAALATALVALLAPPAGGHLRVTSTVPVGAGLASSAAFSVALALALGHERDALALARLDQRAEAASGAHVGLLDPIAIVDATAGHALCIDFASPTLERHQVSIPDTGAFMIIHSEASRRLSASAYSARRAECDRAAHEIGRPLGRCTLGDLSVLVDPILRRRARHVITECARVRDVEQLLGQGDLAGVGEVMSAGHRSLAEDYRVSIPEVDELVEQLEGIPGVLGARMSGGGFGGCVIALCEADSPATDPAYFAPRRAWRVSPANGADVRSVP